MANENTGCVWSNKEKTALCEFKSKLHDLDLSNPILEDRRLINWLRARHFSIPDAEQTLRAHLEWRRDNKIDTILTSDLVPVNDPLLASLPIDIIGHDKQGNTILVVCSGLMDVKALLQTYDKEMCMNVVHYLLETAYADIVQISKNPTALKKAVYICDMDGIRFKDYLSSDVVDLLISSLKEVEANYPELLSKAYLINAPYIFPVLWNVLKPFLSPATIEKVEIIGRNPEKIQSSLLEVISSEELPRKWGGTGFVQRIPALNENNIMDGLSSSLNKNAATNSEQNMIETVIPARKFFDISFDVENPKTVLRWTFKTINYDIGFSLLYKPFHILNSESNKDCSQEKISYKRINAQKITQSGSFVCDVAGHYILRFDNTYSRLRGKTLLHHVEMTQTQLTATNGVVMDGVA